MGSDFWLHPQRYGRSKQFLTVLSFSGHDSSKLCRDVELCLMPWWFCLSQIEYKPPGMMVIYFILHIHFRNTCLNQIDSGRLPIRFYMIIGLWSLILVSIDSINNDRYINWTASSKGLRIVRSPVWGQDQMLGWKARTTVDLPSDNQTWKVTIVPFLSFV